jgi:hypothetical protein
MVSVEIGPIFALKIGGLDSTHTELAEVTKPGRGVTADPQQRSVA